MDTAHLNPRRTDVLRFWGGFSVVFLTFFAIELLGYLLLAPDTLFPLAFAGLWSLILAAIIKLLPRNAGRVVFGIVYYLFLIWTLAQAGYYQVFGKLMWLSTILYAGEGATFLWDVVSGFPLHWWLLGGGMLCLGIAVLQKFPRTRLPLPHRLFALIPCGLGVVGLCLVPAALCGVDADALDGEPEQTYQQVYDELYDVSKAYDICGVYQLTFRDVWNNGIYPMTEDYQEERSDSKEQIDAFFAQRPEKAANEMTGIFSGKNVVLVLMESMDDWMITPEDTPTIYRLMGEGIQFTSFYTPGYGSARTLNSEFCMNTGMYLPTSGTYLFDYMENSFRQSMAGQMTANGYTAEVFHYNSPDFYSRGVLEPAMGYDGYTSYEDFTETEEDLMNDSFLFQNQDIYRLFFREGATFNTIITRSAHLGYDYANDLSIYALERYPEYRQKYAGEEEICARAKARLVDDMFADLLRFLSQEGKLENTVIIAMTDHYTYGYQNQEELLRFSGLDEKQALLLERVPCFIWSADGPCMSVDKTLNTSDLLPTVLNLLGIDSPYSYLGQDAFDPRYPGYALFPDGSWISQGIVCQVDLEGNSRVLENHGPLFPTQEYLDAMCQTVQDYICINNLLLTSNYYQ